MPHRHASAPQGPLLENAEQNIGNSQLLIPQQSAVVIPTSSSTWSVGTVLPQTNPPRILLLAGGSNRGQTTSVVFTVSRVLQGANNPNPGFPGPVTGIIEYGNGAQSSRLEFDLVVGPFAGSINQATSAIEPQDGTVIVSVPTGVLRAYARYDNLLLAPILGTNPPMSLAQWINYYYFTLYPLIPKPSYVPVPIIGPGGPVVCSNPNPSLSGSASANVMVPAEPVLVKAMANYFNKARSRIYKTLNCYLSSETNNPTQVMIPIGDPQASEIGGYKHFAFWTLPAYTKSVKILRFPDSVALDVLLHDSVRPTDYIEILPNITAPEIEIVGNESIIGITTSTANHGSNPVNMLKIVCEIGI